MSDETTVTAPVVAVQPIEIMASIAALLELGLIIKKGIKAKNGLEGIVDELIADTAILSALKVVIANLSAFPAEIKAFGLSEALELVPGLVDGIKKIVDA